MLVGAKMAESSKKYTKYENARIVGARALQISMGAPFFIELSNEELAKIKYNPVEIARMELKKDVLPISVKRADTKK